jgi:hypothetical protein
MWKDIIVEEVHKVRKKLEKEFGSDADAFLKHIYNQQKKNKLFFRSPIKQVTHKVA